MSIYKQGTGCFGCKRSTPLFYQSEDGRMMVNCSKLQEDLPERYTCNIVEKESTSSNNN